MTLSPKWDLEQPSKTSHIVSSWRWKIMKRMMCTVFWSIKTFCIWQNSLNASAFRWLTMLSGMPFCRMERGWLRGTWTNTSGSVSLDTWNSPRRQSSHNNTGSWAAAFTPAGWLHSHLLGGCIHTCWVAAFTPAGRLHSHLLGGCIHTCWTAAFTSSRLLQSDLPGYCIHTCQEATFTPAWPLHSHLLGGCIHTCQAAAFTPAWPLYSHLPGHCIHTCKAAAFTPAWPLHSHLQGCCIHTCLATAFTLARLLHSHLPGHCIHTCLATAFTPAGWLHSHLPGCCIHTCPATAFTPAGWLHSHLWSRPDLNKKFEFIVAPDATLSIMVLTTLNKYVHHVTSNMSKSTGQVFMFYFYPVIPLGGPPKLCGKFQYRFSNTENCSVSFHTGFLTQTLLYWRSLV